MSYRDDWNEMVPEDKGLAIDIICGELNLLHVRLPERPAEEPDEDDENEGLVRCPECNMWVDIKPEIAKLRAEVERLTRERDEAVIERKTMDEVMDSHDTLRSRAEQAESREKALRELLREARHEFTDRERYAPGWGLRIRTWRDRTDAALAGREETPDE